MALKDLAVKVNTASVESGIKEQVKELFETDQKSDGTRIYKKRYKITSKNCKCGKNAWERFCLLCGKEVIGQCKKCHSKSEHNDYPVFPAGLCPHCNRLTRMPEGKVLKAWYYLRILGEPVKIAARKLGVNERTVRRWLNEDMIHLCQHSDCLKMLHPPECDLKVVFLLGRTESRRTTPKADRSLWYGSDEIERAVENCKFYGLTPQRVLVYHQFETKFANDYNYHNEGPTHPIAGYKYEPDDEGNSASRYASAYKEYSRFMKL